MEEIKYNNDARILLKIGIDKIANAVKVTLGPKGRTVIIGNGVDSPHVTKDGVSVARAIYLKDPYEQMGAQLIKEVASKTGSRVGDGTTTATVLAQAMIEIGMEKVLDGSNPIDLKTGIDIAVERVINSLKDQSESIQNNSNRIEQVATISANNDSEIGKLISDVIKKVGIDGTITIDESKTIDTTVDIVDGLQINQGYTSPHFVTDQDKMEINYNNAYLLLVDKKINSLKELLPILQKVKTNPIIILSDDIDNDTLSALYANKMKGLLNVAIIKAPGFGFKRIEYLQDIAILTGAKVFSEQLGTRLEDATIESLGICDKISISRDSSIIVGGHGDKTVIEKYTNDIRSLISITEDEFEIKKLKERLSKLIGGVAVIHVGAASQTEIKEKIDRIDDALCATRAAIEEGILPGGGLAYLMACKYLPIMQSENEDIEIGYDIVKKSITVPMNLIATNAGSNGIHVVSHCYSSDLGFNAKTKNFEDLLLSGIIDPTKVTRIALESAASIAGMVLLTECLVHIEN